LKEAERFESAFNRWLADSGAAFYPAGHDPDSDDYVAIDFSTFLAIVRQQGCECKGAKGRDPAS
jgi:hypothetical protein